MTPRIPSPPVSSLSPSATGYGTREALVTKALGKYIAGATLDILGRAPTAQETAGWLDQLRSGVSRQTLITCLLNSAEKRTHLVNELYRRVFGRDASAAQVRFWCDRLREGITQEEILAELLSSPEYLAVTGTRHEDWVSALYRDLLGRRPTAAETDAWVGLLDSFTAGKREVALDFLRSDEYRTTQIRHWFWQFLKRAPSNSCVESTLERLRQGSTIEDAQSALLTGREYFNLKALA